MLSLPFALPQLRRGNAFVFFAFSLILTISWLPAAHAAKSAADYYVRSLPGAPDGPLLKMHAGHIEVTPEHNGNLFFWHYANRHIANRQRTVIWLNGGPGCSSLDGALMEVGPYRVREGGKLEYNEGSWDEFANLLFVDQPVGTGFSYVNGDSYIHDLKEMADQFVVFLENWFAIFPEYIQDDLYFAGESYAGQYIPYIARAILDRNKQPNKAPWNLKGLLIGNAWISPVDQYPAYVTYVYQHKLLDQGSEDGKGLDAKMAVCNKLLEGEFKNHVDTPQCEAILRDVLRATMDYNADPNHRCMNMYDVRLRDDDSCGMNWPPDLKHISPYLHRPEVLQALNVSPDKKTGWSECSGAVGGAFRPKNAPAVQLLPGILAEIPVLLFSGDKDLICNHIGTEQLINNLSWNGGKGFELSPGVTAPRRDWTFEGEPAGFYQEARNLTYVLFYDSSHMVPFDNARRTRDMLDRFMNVDIASIGGKPTDSRLDGEKGPVTSVGGHPNSTVAEQAEKDRLKEATWKAYYKSAEVALVILSVAAALWGWYIWRERRKRAGYRGLFATEQGNDSMISGMGLESFRNRRNEQDVEAADFDENELDDSIERQHERKNLNSDVRRYDEPPNSRYSLGEGSSSGSDGERREKDSKGTRQ